MTRAEEFASKEGFLAGPVHDTIVRAYEQALKDAKDVLNKRYDDYKDVYKYNPSRYNEGRMDSLDMFETEINTLFEDL